MQQQYQLPPNGPSIGPIPNQFYQSGITSVRNAQAPPIPQQLQELQQQQLQIQQLTPEQEKETNEFLSNLPPEIQNLISTINPESFNQALIILNQMADEVLNNPLPNIQS